MKGYPSKRPRRTSQPVDPVTALRNYAIRLHEKGDGHGVDWARVAEACFRVGFGCLRELPPDDKGLHSVARRAHDAAYGLMTGSPDSGTPYMAAQPERLSAAPYLTPSPELDHTL